MTKIEKLAKLYNCPQDKLERGIIKALFYKIEQVREDSNGISITLSEGEIQAFLRERGYTVRKSPSLTVVKN